MTKATRIPGMFSVEECQAIVQQMWPYLDDALNERDQLLVAQHVAECAKCQSHFMFSRAFLDAVRMAQPPAADLTVLEGRVQAALRAAGFDVA